MEVQNIWDEAHKVEETPEEPVKEDEGTDDASHEETLGSTENESSGCCGNDIKRVGKRYSHI